uniref:H15 domain-containing protein n=1 Tax=Mastacembelus armatus TaxID=205130 RepID=A0A3Q3M0Z8_9TELE
MAEEAPAAAPAKAAAKAPKKKSAARPKKDGPSLSKLIVSAVAESNERKGTSLAALKKVLAAKGVDVTKANKRINTAVTKLVTKGTLSQTKGTGASGSFKLAKKEPSAPHLCPSHSRRINRLFISFHDFSLQITLHTFFLH